MDKIYSFIDNASRSKKSIRSEANSFPGFTFQKVDTRQSRNHLVLQFLPGAGKKHGFTPLYKIKKQLE